MIEKIRKNQFLFEELVKRDFKQKYKRTMLGMAWSVFYPLLNLIVMRIIFTRFFGNDMEHYTTYLFAGNLVFSYFREATMGGMNALTGNAHIFSKVNVPKYMFVLSKNVSAFINFLLTLVVFFVFAVIDQVPFTFKFILIVYPIGCLIVFNIGMGLILSALYMFSQIRQNLIHVLIHHICIRTFNQISHGIFNPHLKQVFIKINLPIGPISH